MKSLLLTAPSHLEIADIDPPHVGPHDVLVRVAACGICGSDVHGYDGGSGRRIPPLVMGHEAAGIVEEVGVRVKGYKAGDRVTFDSMISNPRSWFSRAGLGHLCDDRRVLGVSCGEYRQYGAFAELVSVPEHIVYAVPPDLSLEHAALIEPVSIAVHAVGRASPRLGDQRAGRWRRHDWAVVRPGGARRGGGQDRGVRSRRDASREGAGGRGGPGARSVSADVPALFVGEADRARRGIGVGGRWYGRSGRTAIAQRAQRRDGCVGG